MFARVITAEVAADGFDTAVRVAQEQLPVARQQPGFNGFYLLTDAQAGKAMVISLWETREDLAAVEAQAARVRSEAAPVIGMTVTDAHVYEVAMGA